jgi:hypothetical protein
MAYEHRASKYLKGKGQITEEDDLEPGQIESLKNARQEYAKAMQAEHEAFYKHQTAQDASKRAAQNVFQVKSDVLRESFNMDFLRHTMAEKCMKKGAKAVLSSIFDLCTVGLICAQ